jgi:hypothetical protein
VMEIVELDWSFGDRSMSMVWELWILCGSMNWREEWPGAFECRKDLVPSSTVITLPPVSPVQKKGNQIKNEGSKRIRRNSQKSRRKRIPRFWV